MLEGKDKFLKVYSNLSMDIRKEVIVLIDKQPISWIIAYEEIEKETDLGKKILKNLIQSRFI